MIIKPIIMRLSVKTAKILRGLFIFQTHQIRFLFQPIENPQTHNPNFKRNKFGTIKTIQQAQF
jgi:hypothetical protein